MKGCQNDIYAPAYTSIKALMVGETVARQSGVAIGDYIVEVNGKEFRRGINKSTKNPIQDLSVQMDGTTVSNENSPPNTKETITSYRIGDMYAATLGKIKEIKAAKDPANPLQLTLERHGWNSRANAWHRFLTARNENTELAMKMMQENEAWKKQAFPIDLKREGLQKILKSRAISEIDLNHEGLPPTVYVDYSKLQSLEEGVSAKDVVDAFILFTEILLSRSSDPRNPRTCQFIDLSDATRSIRSGLKVSLLRQIYAVFEPNYPEVLEKMIMYPVSRLVVRTRMNRLLYNSYKLKFSLCILCCFLLLIFIALEEDNINVIEFCE